ncbi:tetratricopeptide repeat protein [Pseudomonas profundi]|uniref:tetratricopeptide repeat protein n=1 Tax=Pseudomonas profundi TaxID=1981513 RepID=UPI00123B75BC|nr:tetratricopeptide repeat protein [Pseudomonas profundi]
MRYSSATKPVRLLRFRTLALAGVAVLVLLVLVLAKEEDFLPDGRGADAVSASYAELMLAHSPEATQLRQELVQLLIDLNQYDRARFHLLEWQQTEPLLADFFRLVIDAQTAMQLDQTDRIRAVQNQLPAFDRSRLPTSRLLTLAQLALSFEQPWLAADIYYELAQAQPDHRSEYLEAAAQWYQASNQPRRASEMYLVLLEENRYPEKRLGFVRKAYSTMLEIGREEDATLMLVAELEQLTTSSPDRLWLEQGRNVALSIARLDLAAPIVERWRQLHPRDPDAVQASFDFALASGDMSAAWDSGSQLLLLRPDDAELKRQMAKVAEWNGLNSEALTLWISYLRLRPDTQLQDYVWRRAFQIFDFERGLPLLTELTDKRQLSDEELDALIYAHESRGTPAKAEEWLRNYLQAYPEHRLGWVRLIQNLENTLQYEAEAETWQAMAEQFQLSAAERVEWAGVHWRLYQPDHAWHVLDIDTDGIVDADYWRTRAGLAWELERDDQLQHAYETMRQRNIDLFFSEESELIELYRLESPRKALSLMVAGWRSHRRAERLVGALELAETYSNFELVAELLADAKGDPAVANLPTVMLARGSLAVHENRLDDAERIYRLGTKRSPAVAVFRERLIWFLIDHGRTDELAELLQEWRIVALKSGDLWLPFAAGNQMLGRYDQALAWYHFYLRGQPDDLLVRAAYADALEGAGRLDQALRLRKSLVARFEDETLAESPERYATWLRLVASTRSGLHAQQLAASNRGADTLMLQVWFDRVLAQLDESNQEVAKDQWLAWARGRGLKIDRYEQLQQGLRQYNRDMLERALVSNEFDPVQETGALSLLRRNSHALGSALSQLGSNPSPVINNPLRLMATDLLEQEPQGIRLGWFRRDFGDLELTGPELLMARHLNDTWYASLKLSRDRYQAVSLNESLLGTETNAFATLQRPLDNGRFSIMLDSSSRRDHDRHGLGVSRQWQLSARDEVELGLDWQRESQDSGLMRALGQADSLWLAGSHGFSARDQLSWWVAHRAFSTRSGESLGEGEAVNLEFNQVQQFRGPTWTTRVGVDYQNNRLRDISLAEAGGLLTFDEPVTEDLLQSRYGRVYVGSTLRRGMPGALNRTEPQLTWLVDVQAGWEWTESEFTYGISTGVGTGVVGDDELAITLGYQSTPRGSDGSSGGSLGITYSRRFGR